MQSDENHLRTQKLAIKVASKVVFRFDWVDWGLTKMSADGKSKRGFASMSPEKRAEIARKGGQSVPAHKRSFATNRELAASAGRKGGKSVKPERRSFSQSHELAVDAGRKGGKVGKPNLSG